MSPSKLYERCISISSPPLSMPASDRNISFSSFERDEISASSSAHIGSTSAPSAFAISQTALYLSLFSIFEAKSSSLILQA